MNEFIKELETQRWDDHRYYHHSRINQSLHFVSAISFVVGYVLLFVSPAMAALLCWLFSMVTRQIGHFFFEPKGFDLVNSASHAHKERIKVGYNLRRKVWLMAVWALSPIVLWLDPTLLGVFKAPADLATWLDNLGYTWIAIGAAALVGRTVQLCFTRSTRTGLAWFTKILTDPFNDIRLYHKAPLHLLRGERLDPDIGRRQHA